MDAVRASMGQIWYISQSQITHVMYGVMWRTSNYSNQLRLYNNLVIIYFEVIPSGVSIIVILPQCTWDLQPCEAIYINYCKIQPFMALAWYSFLGVEEINYVLVEF